MNTLAPAESAPEQGPQSVPDTRDRIIAAAIVLLARGGREALTTRAVAAAAAVQAPTIYRLFKDKQGLVDAVAEHGFTAYLRQKRADRPSSDPVENLRLGWDLHVGFGLSNPAIFAAMYGDPRPKGASPASSRALEMLSQRMRSLALAGRLRIDERQAAEMVRAAACGVVFVLLEAHEAARDPGLSAATRDAVIGAITIAAPEREQLDLRPLATTLRALLPGAPGLSQSERHLLAEWLDRIVHHASKIGALPIDPLRGPVPQNAKPSGSDL